MKCPACGKGKMTLVTQTMPKDGITFEAYRCEFCKEEVATGKQLQVLASKYRELNRAQPVTFSTWGNSLAVRIPREVASELRWKPGTRGRLLKEKDGVRIVQDL